LLAVLISRLLAEHFSPRVIKIIFAIYALTQCLHLSQNYFRNTVQEREHKILIWRDSSRDFLSKQNLVQYFSENGCRLSDISSGDARVLEALRFLAIGNWPVDSTRTCRLGKIRAERAEFALPAPPLAEVANFYLWPETQ
jgi:hypothetical protein